MKAKTEATPHGDWRSMLRTGRLMQFIPLAALALFGTLFVNHIAAMDGAAIMAALSDLTLVQWATALLCTGFSFRAIGNYDVIVHRVFNTGQSPYIARAAGMKAIAISQAVGFGTASSALVRWRCLPDMTASQILRLSVSVSISFLAALTGLAALVVPLSGLLPQSDLLVFAGGGAIFGLVLLAQMALRLGWVTIAVGRRTFLALLAATAADTGFAALALWILWPTAMSFHMLFAAYLIALGAGLVSNAPGGVGAFDLSLLTMLGATNNTEAMAALLAFRVIYYALPATVAILGLFHSRAPVRTQVPDHPEWTLARQSAMLFGHTKGTLLTLPSWGNGSILGDLPQGITLQDLRRQSDPKTLYKCSAVQAIEARRAGWSILRCASDAWIDLSSWTNAGPQRRQLRRALCAFDRCDLHISEVRDPNTLRNVASHWARSHGGEKGHSMGRYCPQYLRAQRVFAAYKGKTPVAFVSFHIGSVWTLDLMRHINDVPKGTMHALVNAGLCAAKDTGAQHLCLASVPAPVNGFPMAHKINDQFAGLRRFKSSFGPRWQPRYLCARSPLHLVLSMITLAVHIRWPAPLPDPNSAQRKHEDFSFAPPHRACDLVAFPIGDHRHDERPFRSARPA